MSQYNSTSVTVAIFGGDLLVGRALERALTSVGHNARLFDGSLTSELVESLSGVRLVLLAPRITTGRRKALLSGMLLMPGTAGLPVLELVTAFDEARDEREEGVGLVAWPCEIEELKRQIETALLNAAGSEPDSNLG